MVELRYCWARCRNNSISSPGSTSVNEDFFCPLLFLPLPATWLLLLEERDSYVIVVNGRNAGIWSHVLKYQVVRRRVEYEKYVCFLINPWSELPIQNSRCCYSASQRVMFQWFFWSLPHKGKLMTNRKCEEEKVNTWFKSYCHVCVVSLSAIFYLSIVRGGFSVEGEKQHTAFIRASSLIPICSSMRVVMWIRKGVTLYQSKFISFNETTLVESEQ